MAKPLYIKQIEAETRQHHYDADIDRLFGACNPEERAVFMLGYHPVPGQNSRISSYQTRRVWEYLSTVDREEIIDTCKRAIKETADPSTAAMYQYTLYHISGKQPLNWRHHLRNSKKGGA
jgi:hypothetical protein